MTAITRLARRTGLPLRHTQGFNPHPVLSLPWPRPTGVATDDDLLVLTLEDDPATDADDLLARLNATALPGMSFSSARELAKGPMPQPGSIRYEFRPSPEQEPLLIARLKQLHELDPWEVTRPPAGKSRRTVERSAPRQARGTTFPRLRKSVSRHASASAEACHPAERRVNLRPLLAELRLEGGVLRWTERPGAGGSARPADVLRLLGLDEREDLARVKRVGVDYETDGTPPAVGASPTKQPNGE